MKQKIIIWGIILFLAIISLFVNKNINKNLEKNKMEPIKETISIKVDDNSIDDISLKYKLDEKYKTEKNYDIIIGKNLEIDNYSKIENGFFSPILIYNVYPDNTLFKPFIEKINNKNYFDLKRLLEEINDTDLYNNKVYIPDKNNVDYKTVLDLIIYSLNDYKEPTEEELKTLSIKANNIINKCKMYSNFHSILLNENDIVLVKENNIINFQKILIPYKTISKNYDIYINNEKKEKIQNILKNDSSIFSDIKYRNIYSTYNIIDKKKITKYKIFEIYDTTIILDNLEKKEIKMEDNRNKLNTSESESESENENEIEIKKIEKIVNSNIYTILIIIMVGSFIFLIFTLCCFIVLSF